MAAGGGPYTYKHLIGGSLVAGASTFDVVNPATGKVMAQAPHASKDQTDAAVAAAKKAFPEWAVLDIEKRRECLEKAVKILTENLDKIAKLLVEEQGKPLEHAKGETMGAIGLIKDAIKETIPVDVYKDTDEFRVEVRRKPVGVVACICPWNFPLYCSICKWAPATVFGNTCVVKPSPFTPLTTMLIGDLIKDCFPAGVLNFVSGDDKAAFNVGSHLSSHNTVDKVTFTGSVPTGKKIMTSCAEDVKRITLEMGGNDACIIRGDMDPAEAAKGVFGGAFSNTGQICCAIKRAYVHESIYDKFKQEIVKCAKESVKVHGNGMTTGVQFGPINNKMQFDKVCKFVEDAKEDGGEILCGGRPLKATEVQGGNSGEAGFFYAPTIVSGLKDTDRLVKDEQFGPVLPILPYKDDDEAIKRANDSPYGLGGSVWSKDIAKANKMASKILSGTVWVNKHLAITGGPFGGFKQSGLGREFGKCNLEAFTECQTLMLAK